VAEPYVMTDAYVAEAIELLEDLLRRHDPEEFGCACVPDKWRCGPCTATERQKPIHAAIKALRADGVQACDHALPLWAGDGPNNPNFWCKKCGAVNLGNGWIAPGSVGVGEPSSKTEGPK
jgi:hypothetical protein